MTNLKKALVLFCGVCAIAKLCNGEAFDSSLDKRMFFQFVFCNTLALESLLVYVIRGCPDIWAFSMVGGFLFALGNLTSVPIIKTIGLGMGFLICACILFFLKTENEEKGSHEENEERKPLLHSKSINPNQAMDSPDYDHIQSDNLNSHITWVEKLSPMTRKIFGCVLAVFAGLCYGCAYTPIIYIKNSSLKNGTSFSGASQFDLDYIFPYMLGINTLTSVSFFGYCQVMKNIPALPSRCVLPAFCGASLLFAAQCAFFTASYFLGTLITFPVGTAGTKNFVILTAVLITVLGGVTLIFLSKMEM
ncbi:transmembrane protein 144-like [Lampris incognitus]|uniref:transmembrane protein 144-like n=1 Tax=Lampris incognitus TaxID=2546036 RepID=UPI0024B5F5AF|nr:transmembrane protein 144-like [Lampris incognitus]